MDIRKWLAEIESPVPSEQSDVEPFLLSKRTGSVLDARRRRKRSSSDSSVLKAPSPQPRRKSATTTERDHCNAIETKETKETITEAHSNTFHSTRSDSIKQITASQHYTRKPRRKTRPDKYEAGLKKVEGQDDSQRPSRKSESKRSRRKPKRKKDDRTHNGVGHDFQARNVSRNRLTLKPLENMGLFSKGRGSTSVKGRGLPDLVFSEMKFLRNNRGGNDHTAQASDGKKKRKKDHTQTKEDDISAFFTSVRPALAETDGNILTKSERATKSTAATKPSHHGRARAPSTVPSLVVPVVESEGRASYLEFSSRGPCHESTSYFSWSESVRAPSVTPGRQKTASTTHRKRIDPSDREVEEVAHYRHASVQQRAPSSVVREPTNASLERAGMSSRAPLLSGLSRSQSLPRPASSPRRPNPINRASQHRTTHEMTSPSSMPLVLRSHVASENREDHMGIDSRSGRSIRASHARENAVSAHSWSSTDAARNAVLHETPLRPSIPSSVLQHCNDTSQADRRQAASRRSHYTNISFSPGVHDPVHQARRGSCRRIAPAPTVRFLAPDIQPSRRPSLSAPSFYVQQEYRQRLPGHFEFEVDYDLGAPGFVGQAYIREPELLEQENFQGMPEEPVSYGTMKDSDDSVAGLDYAADDVEPIRNSGYTNVVTPGFWRPNKLY